MHNRESQLCVASVAAIPVLTVFGLLGSGYRLHAYILAIASLFHGAAAAYNVKAPAFRILIAELAVVFLTLGTLVFRVSLERPDREVMEEALTVVIYEQSLTRDGVIRSSEYVLVRCGSIAMMGLGLGLVVGRNGRCRTRRIVRSWLALSAAHVPMSVALLDPVVNACSVEPRVCASTYASMLGPLVVFIGVVLCVSFVEFSQRR